MCIRELRKVSSLIVFLKKQLKNKRIQVNIEKEQLK